MNEKWHAVHIRHHYERKVSEQLTRKNIENFFPLNRRVHGSERKRISLEPVFDSILFVHITEAEQQAVKQINGVINFMYWLGSIAVIKDEEIAILKQMQEGFQILKTGKTNVNTNEAVKIMEAPVMEIDDVVIYNNNLVNVLLPSLGYLLVAQPVHRNIEVKTIATLENYTGIYFETDLTKNYV